MKTLTNKLGFWLVIVFNLWLLAEYIIDPANARSVVLLFLIQSIILGIENVIKMAASNSEEIIDVNGKLQKPNFSLRIFMSVFFMVHFGVFILVFGIWALIGTKFSNGLAFQPWVYTAIVLLIVGAIIETPKKVMETRRKKTSLFFLMFIPYLRLLPFGALILGNNSLPATVLFPVFLVLKMAVDLVYYRWVDNAPSEAEITPSASV